MLDTLGIGVQVGGLDAGQLLGRGWAVHTKTTLDREDVWASIQAGGVRLGYMAGIGWLAAEASLPPLQEKSNAELLSLQECREAVGLMRDVAAAAARVELPELEAWTVSRFDPVWAWPCDPALYVGALIAARLPRTLPVHYGGSVRWVTRSGRVRGRCYDKAAEQGGPVDLPLRLERQVRRREVVRVDGEVIGRSTAEVLSDRLCWSLLRDTMSELGLDKPIPSLLQTRGRLVGELGVRAGRNSWALLRDLLDNGGVWPEDVRPWTRRRAERQWRAAGVSSVSPVGELPALELPEASG